MRRTLFNEEHQAFRKVIRRYIEKTVVPNFGSWDHAGLVPRSFFREIAELGVIGMPIATEYGGAGVADYRYNMIVQEEAARANVTLGTLRTQTDIILPYFLRYANDEQRRRWLPGIAAGDLLTAIALTEPDTGSDLAGVQTRAVRDGDHYVVDGAKTFITGGYLADLIITLVRTATSENRRDGLSLLVIEDGMPGFTKGRRLDKLGLHSQDTTELHFSAVRVPVANRLGDEAMAFGYLGQNLSQERLAIAVGAVAQTRSTLDATLRYVRERTIFGSPLSSFQNTKFELAAIATDLEAAQAMLDRGVQELISDTLAPADAAKIKLFCTEIQGRAVDRCLQLFGGYGYVHDFQIARLYADARVSRIYGGTSEVMKSIISKSLDL